MRKITIYLAGVILFLLLMYIGKEVYQYVDRTSCPVVTRTSQLSLPSYPNSQQENSEEDLRDGYYTRQIEFLTSDSPDQVVDFYQRHFESEGWEFVDREGNTWLVYREDKALPLYGFTLSITPLATSTKVEILFTYSPCILA